MKKNKVYTVLLIIGIVILLIALIGIGRILWGYHVGTKEYNDVRDQVFITDSSGGDDIEADEDTDELTRLRQQARENASSVCAQVTALKNAHPDVVGWIQFLNLDISYPIMQGATDDDYIYTTWSGTSNSGGSIFLESLNSPDFEDSHSIIYGHNMRNGSMFGKLKQYGSDNIYSDAPYFIIYTPDRAYEYTIFAYFEVPETSEIYTVYHTPSDEFASMVSWIRRNSWRSTGVPVAKDDKVITLSTCSTTGMRFVVCGVRTDTYY